MATIELTAQNFSEIIEKNDTVLIDFWASWCGPCKSFAPTFEAASDDNPDMVFAKVNTEEQRELASVFGIRSIPTLIVFRGQVGVFQQAGALPRQALDSLVEQVRELDVDEVRAKAKAAQDAEGDPAAEA
jgi:thioredoxin 1